MATTIRAALNTQFEVEGLPFRLDEGGSLWVEGWSDDFEFDDQLITSFEEQFESLEYADEEVEITITEEMFQEARKYRDYVRDLRKKK